VDHCLAKFNVEAVSKLLITGHLDELKNKFNGYKRLTDFDFKSKLHLFVNCAVWDIDQGIILTLSENKEVTHAVRGYNILSMPEIKSLYGDPPIFKHLKWPDTNIQINRPEGAHWTLMSFADAYKVPIICHIVHNID
jgi:hypothetical protein